MTKSRTGPITTLVEIPARKGGTKGVRINPLLIGAILPYEAGGSVRPDKCLIHVLGSHVPVKVYYAPDVVCDMLGIEVIVAEQPAPEEGNLSAGAVPAGGGEAPSTDPDGSAAKVLKGL